MKILRICLLVLLAALLPVRGAIAAAMLCPPAVASTADPHAMHGEHDDHASAAAEEVPDHAAHHAGTEKCQLCCDLGSLNPLPSALPSVPAPHAYAALAFPELVASAASFLSDGQERPPRSD